MAWLKNWIEARERWHLEQENNRRVLPFAWGPEHVGGRADEPDPREFFRRHAEQALAASDPYFAVSPAVDCELRDGVLTFTSAIESPYRENNTVCARFFPAASQGRAVVVLPQWNADWESHVNICRFLNHFGISALRLSLPYHDRRKPPGLERADYMVSPNVGLTVQASRQAVLDARRALRWLEEQGYRKLAILGTSIGSSVAFITLAHEPALCAGVCLHVSTYFADAVRTGITTAHVWEGLKDHVSGDELRSYWAPVSPYPYVTRLKEAGKPILLVTAKYDLSFRSELSEKLIETMAIAGIPTNVLRLPCGHYTLAMFPFSYAAGLRFASFLRRALA